MKKLYTTIALSIAVVASASAFEVQKMQKTATFGQMSQKVEFKSDAAKVKKSAVKKINSAFDLEGVYDCEYEAALVDSEGNPSYTKANAVIEATDNAEVVISLEPWASTYSNVWLDPILASVDLSASTLTITAEDNFEIGGFTPSGGAEVPLSIVLKEANLDAGMWEDAESVTATINADGSISFPETTRILIQGGNLGYLGGFDALTFVAPDYFSFVENEWTNKGKAKFYDHNTGMIFTEEYQPAEVDVNLFQNKAVPSLYCIEKPYAYGGWTQLNEDANSKGYIVFNIENPNFVYMRMLSGSGFWIDIFDDGIPQELYMYNLEGMYIMNYEYTVADAAKLFASNKVEASTYNANTGVVKLINPLFGVTDNPYSSYSWTNVEDAYLQITMPAAGVEGIVNDAENVAKRYFNLQGVEIVNPEAGQVVIVKEGKKATKMVVR